MKLNKTSGFASFISSGHSGRNAIIERLINNKFFPGLKELLKSNKEWYVY